jgi:hypothetical protein
MGTQHVNMVQGSSDLGEGIKEIPERRCAEFPSQITTISRSFSSSLYLNGYSGRNCFLQPVVYLALRPGAIFHYRMTFEVTGCSSEKTARKILIV